MSDNRTVNILLVEDDEIDAEALQRSFAKHKIANPITVAKDGLEALQILRGADDREPFASPYIILLDLNMPRMNGIEFLEAIRADDELRNHRPCEETFEQSKQRQLRFQQSRHTQSESSHLMCSV